MTQLEPTITLKRLIVMRGGAEVYDEHFHDGVNIIRGENGSGKTTIADFIFYSLGGDVTDWRQEALLCDAVFSEVAINGSAITLKRDISKQPQQPLAIFFGNYASASANAIQGWQVFPYAKRSDKQSFSEAIFNAMKMPHVKGELASRITMHQLLRLMYVDQRSSYEDIFRTEIWDNKLIRDAVGSLLCGIYDAGLYDAEIQHRNAKNDYSEVNGKLTQALAIFEGRAISVAMLEEEAVGKRGRRDEIQRQLGDLQLRRVVSQASVQSTAEHMRLLEERLRNLNENAYAMREEVTRLDLEISDSGLFIDSLLASLRALDDAQTVKSAVGELEFQRCPACLLPLPESVPGLCAVCRQSVAPTEGSALMRLRQELTLQLQESETLQENREKRREELKRGLPGLLEKRTTAEAAFRTASLGTESPLDAQIGDLNRQMGYIDRELEDIQDRMKWAQAIEALSARKADLASTISKLSDQIQQREAERTGKSSEAFGTIASVTTSLLKEDLDREGTFQNAQTVSFNFGDGKVMVDGRSNYAASSMVYLKNCFHLAVLLASTQKAFFRYPRFLLFDNVEDKGMEPERSQNFQRLIVEHSAEVSIQHQIIFTTSMIASDLDVAGLTVGERYTHTNKSLKILNEFSPSGTIVADNDER